MRARVLVATVASSLVLAACGATATERKDVPLTPLDASCAASAGPPSTGYATLPLLPDDVEPVGVIECQNTRPGDGGSGWIEQRATTGIAAYVDALRLPDQRRPLLGVNCTASALLIPWSAVLLADGTALRVGTPVDVCGSPRREAVAAYEALGWSETAREPAAAG